MQPAVNRLIAFERALVFNVIVFRNRWQAISEKEKQSHLHLFEKGTGMVFLQHALASYQHWPAFMEIRGGKSSGMMFIGWQ